MSKNSQNGNGLNGDGGRTQGKTASTPKLNLARSNGTILVGYSL